MEVKFQINYIELLNLISQLPVAKKHQLKTDLTTIEQPANTHLNDKQALKNLILNGPVMQEEEYQEFLESQKWLNEWRKV